MIGSRRADEKNTSIHPLETSELTFETPNHATWIMESPPGPETTLNGRRYLYFAGTGYLGLQGHPEVLAAAADAVRLFGVHSATSRSGFGNSAPVLEVERRAADFLGTEDALYLATGYAANLAIVAALEGNVDLAFLDADAHDSLRDAVRYLTSLQRAPITYRHRDPDQLRELLREHAWAGSRPLVLTDGIFAVSGELAPVAEYIEILSEHENSMILVDDAHALGVLGNSGRGSFEHAGLETEATNRDLAEPGARGPRMFQSATLSKAIGGHGGLVTGSRAFLNRVRARSGWYRAASAPPASIAAATAKCLEIHEKQPELREQLLKNVSHLRRGLRDIGLPVVESPSPILGIRIESKSALPEANAERMLAIQRNLEEQGILVAYSSAYTGAGPAGMLRIAVFATHEARMLDQLILALAKAIETIP